VKAKVKLFHQIEILITYESGSILLFTFLLMVIPKATWPIVF
jgi:hypothetical protein